MELSKIPFKIDFPLEILSNKKTHFKNKWEREKIFRRHIYYYKYFNIKNSFLKERGDMFLILAEEIKKIMKEEYPKLDVLSISVFGSSLYSKKPGDFDFLVITKGNLFLYNKKRLVIEKNGKKIICPVGISIKGLENFSEGIFDIKSPISLNLQSQIIYRTVISLFRRHIPLIGYDFKINKRIFIRNVYAQVSDLLTNAYELYYLNKSKLSKMERSRKILSRVYEAVSYLCFLCRNKKLDKFRRNVYSKIYRGSSLSESKKIFDETTIFYEKEIKNFDKNKRNKKVVLKILLKKELRKNIQERLENYWKSAKLPYKWISPILETLSKYSYDEDLAIKEVRSRFPSIPNKNSLDYSKKLNDFRKLKIKNLVKRIEGSVLGELIADVGGRSDDFVEEILSLKKNIKKAYVTDLCSFTDRSQNPKVHFIVQSSLTKVPFVEKNIDTIILSMVLHHLSNKSQKEMIKNLVSYLNAKGRIILIEDTYPEKINLEKQNNATIDFLVFNRNKKTKILRFYDWFGNRLMRNRDNIPLFYNYKTMEEWKNTFEKYNLKQIKSEFIKENLSKPDIFPPKAIMVFQKR